MFKREEMLAFGGCLKRVRMACGLKQSALSLAAGIDRSTISYYESGALFPSMAKLCRLSEILATPVDILLGGVENPKHLFNEFQSDAMLPDSVKMLYQEDSAIPEDMNKLDSGEQMLILTFRALTNHDKNYYIRKFNELKELQEASLPDEEDTILNPEAFATAVFDEDEDDVIENYLYDEDEDEDEYEYDYEDEDEEDDDEDDEGFYKDF